MVGAILGDIVGSRFEFENHLDKNFDLIGYGSRFTDDTVMTCAVAFTLLEADGDWSRLTNDFIVKHFKRIGKMYPGCGYGRKFFDWMNYDDNPKPYNSCGNGSAMRISPVGWVANSEEEVKMLSAKLTEVSHDHPEGMKGAECTAMCVYLARNGASMKEIYNRVTKEYYMLDKTCDEYRLETNGEHGKEICQITVPQALECFFESNSFEDCIRNCISIGGDSDTIAAIAGGIAEAYYGIPNKDKNTVLKMIPELLKMIVCEFTDTYY